MQLLSAHATCFLFHHLPALHHLFALATFDRPCTILPSSVRFPSSASGISPTLWCILDARVQLSLLRWLGTTAGTSYFSLLPSVASSSIFRLMLFPHLHIYVRAFRGPVGACVRLCLGDPSRPALPRPGVRAAVELTA